MYGEKKRKRDISTVGLCSGFLPVLAIPCVQDDQNHRRDALSTLRAILSLSLEYRVEHGCSLETLAECCCFSRCFSFVDKRCCSANGMSCGSSAESREGDGQAPPVEEYYCTRSERHCSRLLKTALFAASRSEKQRHFGLSVFCLPSQLIPHSSRASRARRYFSPVHSLSLACQPYA